MTGGRHPRRRAWSALVCATALLISVLGPSSAMARQPLRSAAAASSPVTVTVNATAAGPAVRPGFLGLSIEYWAIESYAGKDPRSVNPVLVKLIRNLAPGQSPVIRVGGVTTDWTWWPIPGLTKPSRVNYILSPRRLGVTRALAQATGGRLILGTQFEADNPLEALTESRIMLATIGRGRIQAFELGNEPDLYGGPWDVQHYLAEFRRMATAMGNVPVAGPALGSASWLDELDQQLSQNPHLDVVTAHKYPLEGCASSPGAPDYPTIHNLLAPASSHGIAEFLQPYVRVAHAHHVQIRDGEINTVTCGSGAGVSNTFASALWALDTMFELANVGVDGVNMHTYPGAPGQLFSFKRAGSHWLGSVEPEYYGLLAFAQAAPAGARLLSVAEPGAPATLHAWGTRAPDGTVRVVLINEDGTRAAAVRLIVTGASRVATLARLQAPSLGSTSGVQIGGQTISSHTGTGALSGRLVQTKVKPRGGAYVVSVPAASAATLTLR